jgi:hypothetical protein
MSEQYVFGVSGHRERALARAQSKNKREREREESHPSVLMAMEK